MGSERCVGDDKPLSRSLTSDNSPLNTTNKGSAEASGAVDGQAQSAMGWSSGDSGSPRRLVCLGQGGWRGWCALRAAGIASERGRR
ncbi:hypothetical protein AXF42_Ash008781 [Apostasia shenzhenica]|uniref:Uncharacterized protein n=1 Tax=Apostasia shenzhenica TaxID=1088818 RepID=A0A2I0ASF9_9ASPA|nr:hypothetical protein AXF42_Ash008781 [Apostasia shenzhenica]